MNTKKSLFVISIILNAGLIAAMALFVNRREAVVPALLSAPAPAPRETVRSTKQTAYVPVNVTNEITVDWRMVESEDYKRYIANLRAIGCPEETIRDIIIADVNKLFASRRRQASGPSQEEFKFWKKGRTMFRGLDEEKIKQQKELAREKHTLIKDLLGIDYVDNTSTAEAFNPFSEMLSFLSQGKQQQVAELEATYVAKQEKLFENRGAGPPTPEDRAKFRELERQKEAEIAKTLTPQEFEDYQLRMSQSARALRSTLGDFDATEQEFRDLYKARKAFDDQFGPFSNNDEDPATFVQRTRARADMEKQLQQTLGPDRFKQWDYESQYASSSLRNVAEEHGIPRENIYQAFDVRKETQRVAADILANSTLSAADRQAALANVRNAAELEWRNLLGNDGYNTYTRRGSRWLDQISPPQNVAAK
jgi:hypothetical protein